MIHIWRPWKLPNFQKPLPPLPIYVQNSSTPLTLDVQFQMNFPPFQKITNLLKENIIQEWTLYNIRFFFLVGFRFRYQLINLVWSSFDFPSHHLAEASLSSFFYGNNRTIHVNERNQNKKQNQVTFKLTTRSIVQFSPLAMQWYH